MKLTFPREESIRMGSPSPQSPWDASSPGSVDSPLQAFSTMSLASILSPQSTLAPPWLPQREMGSEDRGLWLIRLLLACANHVSGGHMENTNICLEQLSLLASPTGDSMQRVATYFMEALAARITKSWPGLHKALNCTNLTSASDRLSARHIFFNLCPLMKISMLAVNQSIVEAMETEKFVHIIDLNALEPIQWVWLMHALSARNGGPPNLRITGVSEHKEVLHRTGRTLAEEAERLSIPFQFHPVVANLENLEAEELNVKIGQAVAVSSVLRLHTLLAEEDLDPTRPLKRTGWPPVCPAPRPHKTLDELFRNERRPAIPSPSEIEEAIARKAVAAGVDTLRRRIDRFLGMIRCLSPKVTVLVEQDSNHNLSSFMERFVESMHYYGAVFDSLASDIPGRHAVERLAVEKHLFGEEIKNIVACEGSERKERHEKLERWFERMERTGFVEVPVSNQTVLQAKSFLEAEGQTSKGGYRLNREHGCLLLGWQERALLSVSAWRSRV